MRIARVSIGFRPRVCGWSHHATYLSEAQVRLGHEVVVLQPFPVGDSVAEGVQVEQIVAPLLRDKWGSALGRVQFARRAARCLREAHRARPFDVVHVHGDVHELVALLPVASNLHVPLVITCHSGLQKTLVYRVVARQLYGRADRVVAVSQGVVDDLLRLDVPRSKILLASSGVDTLHFAPPTAEAKLCARAALGIPAGAFVVICVARLDPVKGHRNLVAAAEIARQTVPDLVLLLAGDGPLRSQLQRDACGAGWLQFLGEAAPSTVVTSLQAADCFALTSVDLPGVREGTPTAVLEAMACGLPVVVSDSGGLASVSEPWPGVSPVRQEDPSAVAEALHVLAYQPWVAASLGGANRKRALARDWIDVARTVTDVYPVRGG